MRTHDEENEETVTGEPDAVKDEMTAVAGLGFEWGPYDRPLPSEVNPAADPGGHRTGETDEG
jgi:hypothetical protein